MICTQPPLDVCGIAKNGRCRCLCCGLLGGERADRVRCWRLLGWTSKKGVGQGKRRGGIERWVFLCFLVLFLFFLAYLFQCRSIDFLSRSSQLLDGLLLQDFSSSRPNLAITFLLSNYSVRVNCGKQLYLALAQDRVANFLRSSLLISYWLLRFVFSSKLEIRIELLMHWGRLIDYSSSPSQLLDGDLLQRFLF